MEKKFIYEPPIEISDSSFISLLTVKRTGPRVYKGRVECLERSDDGGRFRLWWRAEPREGEYDVIPTKKESIELEGMLRSDQFTHSDIFDKALRNYINQQLINISDPLAF